MPEKLLIHHVDPGSIPDGWHTAEIASFQPWEDHNTAKAAIYFRLTEGTYDKCLLLWFCPLVATRRNKTGRLLRAFGIDVSHGQDTDITSLQGCTLQIYTWLTTDETGRVILITDFRPGPKGE